MSKCNYQKKKFKFYSLIRSGSAPCTGSNDVGTSLLYQLSSDEQALPSWGRHGYLFLSPICDLTALYVSPRFYSEEGQRWGKDAVWGERDRCMQETTGSYSSLSAAGTAAVAETQIMKETKDT